MKPIEQLTTSVLSKIPDIASVDALRNCSRCGVPTFTRENALDVFCKTCISEIESEKQLRSAEKLKEAWERICPPIHKQTEIEKLPNREASNSALAWKFNERGLLLHGQTGTGKSRTAWLILKAAHFDGKKILVLNSASAIRYAAIFSTSTADAEKWIDRHANVDVLFMDDAFKVKLTESYEAALFAVIDSRMENLRPIIATTNDTGETLAGRMSQDRGAAMVRRLRECCDSIGF